MQFNLALILLATTALAIPAPQQPVDGFPASAAAGASASGVAGCEAAQATGAGDLSGSSLGASAVAAPPSASPAGCGPSPPGPSPPGSSNGPAGGLAASSDSTTDPSSVAARAWKVHDERSFISGIKHFGSSIGQDIKGDISKIKDFGKCKVGRCALALGPNVVSCVLAAAQEEADPISDAKCFASTGKNIVDKPSACDNCPF